jgi:hypothetical protein
MQNQATGLLPLLLFMLLNNFFSYKLSFIIAVLFCVISLVLYRILSKDKVYLFLLLPASATLMLYAVFLFLRLEPVLFTYSPVIIEVLLVVVMAIIGFTKQTVVRRLRNSRTPAYRKTMLRTALNEFYFLVRIIQSIYTLHLFVILFCTMLPEDMCNEYARYFLFRYMGLILGIGVIGYEQIRLFLMQGSLKKEMWLPVLDDSEKVIGCMARSVSRTATKKYCHPVVRVAIVYNGMLYLTKRNRKDYVSPDTLDYPFQQDVIYRHTVDTTVKDILGTLPEEKDSEPRFMIRYMYENEKVKQQVSLFVLCLRTEEQFAKYRHFGGKLWTEKQIDENLGKDLYSGYFEEEYPYLKNTILFAENFLTGSPVQ